MSTNYTEIVVDEIKKVSNAAVLCEIDGDTIWIPRSLIIDGDELEEDDIDVEISVKAWFCKQEGLV